MNPQQIIADIESVNRYFDRHEENIQSRKFHSYEIKFETGGFSKCHDYFTEENEKDILEDRIQCIRDAGGEGVTFKSKLAKLMIDLESDLGNEGRGYILQAIMRNILTFLTGPKTEFNSVDDITPELFKRILQNFKDQIQYYKNNYLDDDGKVRVTKQEILSTNVISLIEEYFQ